MNRNNEPNITVIMGSKNTVIMGIIKNMTGDNDVITDAIIRKNTVVTS